MSFENMTLASDNKEQLTQKDFQPFQKTKKNVEEEGLRQASSYPCSKNRDLESRKFGPQSKVHSSVLEAFQLTHPHYKLLKIDNFSNSNFDFFSYKQNKVS
jgi:hypothetical protein